MRNSRRLSILVAMLIMFGVSTVALAQRESVENAYFAAHDADAPLRNLVYLLLRVAGVIWVAIEWVAAITLILAYRMLHHYLTANRVPTDD